MTETRMDLLSAKLAGAGQLHLLEGWHDLTDSEQSHLAAEIESVDWGLVSELCRGSEEQLDWTELAQRADPPPAVRPAADPPDDVEEARRLGEAALRAGRVGMVLVAGGQGTRLGFDHPKGMFPLGPVSNRSLFQIIVDQLRAVGRTYGASIPLYLMTSPATDRETADYFAQNSNCGLADSDLKVFCQGVMPAVEAATGRALLQTRSELCLSPDGHGGMLAAFTQSGCLADAQRRGIDLLFYGQVDNPLLQVCDPLILGCHLAAESEMTTQVVRKVDSTEKVGNVVQVDGSLRIIEYSDLPADVAAQRSADGALKLWAGNLGVHVFDLRFLERMVDHADSLPFHRASKVAEHIDGEGRRIQPSEPNALKFERFIFDLLPAAERALVVECEKRDAFAPVKNAAGAATDTADHARQAMIDQHSRILEQAGIVVRAGVAVEVNPLWALDASQVELEPGTVIESTTYFAKDSAVTEQP